MLISDARASEGSLFASGNVCACERGRCDCKLILNMSFFAAVSCGVIQFCSMSRDGEHQSEIAVSILMSVAIFLPVEKRRGTMQCRAIR